jgi:Transglycosylase
MADPPGRAGRLNARRVAPLVAGAALVALVALPALVAPFAAARLRAVAREHALTASWRALAFEAPASLRVRGLALVSASGDTVGRLDSLLVTIDLASMILLHPRPRIVALAHAAFTLPERRSDDADTLADDATAEDSSETTAALGAPAPSQKVRHAVRQLIDALLLPARRLPRLEVRDVTIARPHGESGGIRLTWLSLASTRSGARFEASGVWESAPDIPFTVGLQYGRDDQLSGGARFGIPDASHASPQTLAVAIEGRVHQERRQGIVTIGDSLLVRIGSLPFLISGSLERAAPRIALRVDAMGFTADRVRESIAAPLLGTLEALRVRGSWDHHAWLDLDLSRPDSVRLGADVAPHGLVLESDANRPPLTMLGQPFTALVHLPKERVVARELSSANAHYVPLDRMDSTLVEAVITNEDGGFFRHRGFNLQAVRGSLADNIRAGRFRRGAGTITMQLVRNLYLGHERTLSRKAQEVVLAWVLEHLTGVEKRRMLEIYLNIIEWGPDVLGADEAAQYYFGHDVRRLSVAEALFMTTVLPAPVKWKWRFDRDGTLRPFERAQMHFIGRAMIAKGWLAPDQLPSADSLNVEIRGPARAELFAAGVSAALDSLRSHDLGSSP